MTADVEIDLYSGRPNPRFDLSGAEAAEFDRRLAALPATSAESGPMFEGLGYRGFRVTLGRADIAEVTVAAGRARIRSAAGKERYCKDTGRALERWLAEIAAGRAPDEDLRIVNDALPR